MVTMGLFNFFLKDPLKNKKNMKKEDSSLSPAQLNFPVREEETSTQSLDEINCNTPFSNANFLKWADGKSLPSDGSAYPKYMQYRYSITQPLKKHEQMISEGFLIEGDAKDSLSKLKVQELKNILSEHNIPATGKKDVLIQRIIENVDCSNLNFPKILVLTEKGKNYLSKYNYYIEFNEYISQNIIELSDLSKFDDIKKEQPYLRTNDIVWHILQMKYFEYMRKQSYGLVRNIELSRYRILEKEGKKKDATYHLLIVFYYDLSGMHNNGTILKYNDLFIAPGLIQPLRSLKDFIDSNMIHRIYQRIDVPFRYFNEDIFYEIICDLLNADIDLNHYLIKANTANL